MDLLDTAGTGYYLVGDVLTNKTAENVVTPMVLDSVSL
jgi:hypothetical protein